MDNIAETIRDVVFSYAGGGFNLRMFSLANEDEKVYAVTVVDTPIRKRSAGVVVLARVEGENVIIEEDITDRPLKEAFVRAGIPRENIILAHIKDTTP
jgi:hypothetical protein